MKGDFEGELDREVFTSRHMRGADFEGVQAI